LKTTKLSFAAYCKDLDSVRSLQVEEPEVCAIFLSPYIPVPRPGASCTVVLLLDVLLRGTGIIKQTRQQMFPNITGRQTSLVFLTKANS
jgi:hypothetical protein